MKFYMLADCSSPSVKQVAWMSLVTAVLVYDCTYVTMSIPWPGRHQQTHRPRSTDSDKPLADFAMRGRTSEDASAMQGHGCISSAADHPCSTS